MVKKTSAQMLSDSYDRAENEQITSYKYGDNLYYVYNSQSNGEYIVTVDNVNQVVVDCTCPHRQYRLATLNVPCKHMVAVSMALQYTC